MILVDQFNDFFGEAASAVIENNDLKITIGTQTLSIGLPTITGIESTGPLSES